MPRITLSQIESLPDVLSSEHFTLQFGEIPNVGDGLQLMLKYIDCNIPGFSTEAFDVMLHGVQRGFRGRRMYPRSLACSFVEDSTMDTLNTLRQWMEQIVGTDSNTSVGGILDYAVPATLTIFDQAGNDIDSMNFINCFVQDVPDVQVTGESSTLMRITATFKYDYAQYRGVNIR